MIGSVDDARKARVRLVRASDGGFSIECEVIEDDAPPAVHGPFPLDFDGFDDRAVVAWFATHIGEPPLDVYRMLTGPTLREPEPDGFLPLPPVEERSVVVEVPAGSILPLIRVLTPIGVHDLGENGLQVVGRRRSEYRAGGEQWLPALHGPGVMENRETGQVLLFEGLRLLDERRVSLRRMLFGPQVAWAIGARTVEVTAIGGPVVLLGLLSAPTRSGAADELGRAVVDGAGGPDLVLETSVGSFVCRAPSPRDLPALSRVEPHLPPWLSLGLSSSETHALLRDLAATSAEHRDASGRLDWSAFRAAVIEAERVEVLEDEGLGLIVAVRYRRLLRDGGSILRTLNRAEGDAARWEDESRSLWELARAGWTQRSTVAIRPRLTRVFADPRADDVVAALAAGEHVHDLGDVLTSDRSWPWSRDAVVDRLLAFIDRLRMRISEVEAHIESAFDDLSTSNTSERLAAVMSIEDLTSELHDLELEDLRWRRWIERGHPDELPISSDELVDLLIEQSHAAE